MKNQIINGSIKELIVASPKFCVIACRPGFLSSSLTPPFTILFIYDNPRPLYITIRRACSYGKKKAMLKLLFFFLLGILASLVVFFTPWWLTAALVVLLILFRLVKTEARLNRQMSPRQPLHHRRSIQKFEP